MDEHLPLEPGPTRAHLDLGRGPGLVLRLHARLVLLLVLGRDEGRSDEVLERSGDDLNLDEGLAERALARQDAESGDLGDSREGLVGVRPSEGFELTQGGQSWSVRWWIGGKVMRGQGQKAEILLLNWKASGDAVRDA